MIDVSRDYITNEGDRVDEIRAREEGEEYDISERDEEENPQLGRLSELAWRFAI